MRSPGRKRPLAGVIVLMLAGCGGGADEAASTEAQADVREQMPPVHVEQTAEVLHDGANEARNNYVQTVRDCQAAGLPTRALPEADVALLGTTKYELWFDRDQEVVRTRAWQLAADGPAPSCQFRLELSGSQEMQSAKANVQVDLATGERSESPADADALLRVAAEPGEGDSTPGFRGPARRSVAGQPCNEWTEDDGRFRQCVWSGGARWGFTPGGLQDYRPSRDVIVLEQEPLDGQGIRVTTQVMTVGKPFDRAQLEAPRPVARGH
jgi:hypothetical protein